MNFIKARQGVIYVAAYYKKGNTTKTRRFTFLRTHPNYYQVFELSRNELKQTGWDISLGLHTATIASQPSNELPPIELAKAFAQFITDREPIPQVSEISNSYYFTLRTKD